MAGGALNGMKEQVEANHASLKAFLLKMEELNDQLWKMQDKLVSKFDDMLSSMDAL